MTKGASEALSDEELAVHIRSASPDDFRILIERYQQKLFRYALKYINDQDRAEDIVQEALVKIYQNLNNFDAKRTFSAWAYRITHNEVINNVRKNKNQVDIDDDSWIPDLADDRPSPAEEFDKELSKKELHSAISQLPMKYRQILVLYYFQGCDYESIATILGIPISTVSTRMSRAKQKLKKLLRKEHVL